MRVLLDHEPCESTASTIGDAIADAARAAEARGRMIIEVVVDGTRWTESELAQPELVAGTAREITLLSTDPRALVAHTLDEASESLLEADALTRRAAEGIQANQDTEALQQLGDALGIWRHVQEAVLKCARAIDLNLDEFSTGSTPFPTSVERLHRELMAIQASIEAQDPAGLADTLLYELPDVTGEWREILETLRAHARTETA